MSGASFLLLIVSGKVPYSAGQVNIDTVFNIIILRTSGIVLYICLYCYSDVMPIVRLRGDTGADGETELPHTAR